MTIVSYKQINNHDEPVASSKEVEIQWLEDEKKDRITKQKDNKTKEWKQKLVWNFHFFVYGYWLGTKANNVCPPYPWGISNTLKHNTHVVCTHVVCMHAYY